MKLAITKDAFANGLQAVQNVVGARTTLPILSNVLLQAEDNRLCLTATDLDVTVACSVEAKVVRKGATTLPAKRLFSMVREAALGEIELEMDERNLCVLRSGPSVFKIRGLPAEDYPPLPSFAEQQPIVLPQDRLKAMLRRSAFAASTDESRYVLNGIYFSLKDHKVTAVATDGRRLALTDEEADIGEGVNVEFIIPTKAVAELTRLLQDKGTVELRHTENQAAFRLVDEAGGAVNVTTKLVEGTYPNYQQVIPRECKERVTLVREEFIQALRRAEIMTSDKSNSVKLHFQRNTLLITANTPDVGEAQETVAINYRGADLAVAFNPVFLVEALRALDTEDVFFELTDELSPGVVKINGPFLYVIMPMRTN